ncbi:MAG TPA: hypothetical protein VKE98_11895, partial [Gemmataceae bacterium]|nr:hypothetical protein [Gemmataceae bacterium]
KGELEKLTLAQLEMLWADLDGKARPAFVGMQRLAAAPKQSVPFLGERLRPKVVDPQRVRDLVSDLGSPKLPVRDMASAELRKLGAAAEDRLRNALQDDPSADTRGRVQELLKLVESSHRDVRAIELLERIGTSEAQDLLARLGKEAPSLRLRQQALDSAARIQKRVAGVK